LVFLFSRIINYTKKSLKSHDLSDFSFRGVFLQPLPHYVMTSLINVSQLTLIPRVSAIRSFVLSQQFLP